jgi:hypothetical protein
VPPEKNPLLFQLNDPSPEVVVLVLGTRFDRYSCLLPFNTQDLKERRKAYDFSSRLEK